LIAVDRDTHYNIGPMTADKLVAFENVRAVRDYVSVNAFSPDFTSLSFFKNMRTIKGQSLARKYVYDWLSFQHNINKTASFYGPSAFYRSLKRVLVSEKERGLKMAFES